MNREEWRACLKGDHEISSEGRIRRATPAKGTRVGRLMTPQVNRNGYLAVSISRWPKNPSTVVLHPLVAAAFVGPKPPGLEINHKDGNKQNNRAGNLEYVTRSVNCREAIRIGLRVRMTHPPPHVPGEKNGRALLTEEDVRAIRRRRKDGERRLDLAREYGVSYGTIGAVLCRRNWRHVA